MDDRLIVTASPHIRDNATTRGLMGNVLIALVPSIVASGLIFGMRAILLTAVTTLACVVFEYLYCKLMHKPHRWGSFCLRYRRDLGFEHAGQHARCGLPLWAHWLLLLSSSSCSAVWAITLLTLRWLAVSCCSWALPPA